jgi:tetratricopeptide (TPR) repeat protein
MTTPSEPREVSEQAVLPDYTPRTEKSIPNRLTFSTMLVFVGLLVVGPGAGAQRSQGFEALFQAIHEHSYAHGQYEGMFTATPQQQLERVDRNTLQELAVTSNTLLRNANDVGALVRRGYAAMGAAHESMYRDAWLHFAAQDLEKSLRLDPNNFVARHDYAETCYEAGDVSPAQPVMHLAVTQFTKAIQLNPRSARSYMGRGLAYLMLKDQAHANPDLQQALHLDPSLRPELEKDVNATWQQLGRIAGAQQTLRAMGSYTVDPTARTAEQCADKKGYWTNGQCRFTDLGLHQGISIPNSPGTGTYGPNGGGVFVR